MNNKTNGQDTDLRDQLFNAAKEGNLESIRVIAAESPDLLGSKDERGFTPLIMAAYYDQLEAVKFLVEQGVDINEQDGGGNTALMGAAFKNYLKIAEYLVESGADLSVRNPKGMTAADFAIHFGNLDMAKMLEAKMK